LQDLVAELGSNAVSRRRLLPSMMRLLGHTHLWGQASNFFTLLVEGCGGRRRGRQGRRLPWVDLLTG
jgi:hypothetical protein